MTEAKAKSWSLISCAAGILGSLLLYGVLQERLMGERFGSEQFTFTLLLVLANRLVSLVTAIASLKASGQSLRSEAPLWAYGAISASNIAATSCQYEALKHVMVSVQTLGKSAKMLPVLIWASVLLGKRYSLREYARAILIASGCTLFLSTGQVTSKFAEKRSTATAYGVSLMGLYLAFDGFTSTFQSRIFKGFKTSVNTQMLYTTAISATYALVGLAASGQLPASLAFVQRHLVVLVYMLLLSAASTVGQFWILQTIKLHGPVVLSVIMTSRQFLTILLSCLIFRHTLLPFQWLGVLLVFAAIIDQLESKRKQKCLKI